jgi:hypothetical protein
MFGRELTDPIIQEMDDVTRQWYFYNWLEDQNEEGKKMKDFGCFIGSFTNAEMARKIHGSDGDKRYDLDDDEFDKSLEFVKESLEKIDKEKGKRKRRKIVFKK